MITTSESPHEFFSWEKAEQNAMCRKPVPGVDYPQKDVDAEMCVDCEVRPAPEDTLLMNFVLVETMIKMIEAESKANCEACQVNSDSQFDHCRSGNCLDEDVNQYDLYLVPACHQYFLNSIVLLNALQLVTGATGLLSQGATAVNHGCSVRALGSGYGETTLLVSLHSSATLWN